MLNGVTVGNCPVLYSDVVPGLPTKCSLMFTEMDLKNI